MTSKFGWEKGDIEIIKQPTKKAEPNPQLTPQGHQALSITEALKATDEIKNKAKDHVGWLVRSGKKPPARTLKCRQCGKQAEEYHHHKGYAKENWGDVIPLCRSCQNIKSNYSDSVKKKLRRDYAPLDLRKAELNKDLTLQGQQALAITEGLEDDIRQRWAKLMAAVEAGVSISKALAAYERDAMGLIRNGMREAWLVGHKGSIGEAEQKAIDEALGSQQIYLEDFMKELENELTGVPDEEQGGWLLGSAARAVLYAGSVWALYNTAKLFGAPPEALYEFRGPSDAHTCQGCYEEVSKGPRPAREIRSPGSLECLGNCRHEVVRVR